MLDEELLENLIFIINHSRKYDKNYQIAWTLLHDVDKIEGIYELADQCGVSPSAITRFCHEIGVDNFQLLKTNFSSTKKIYKRAFFMTRKDVDLYSDEPEKAFSEQIERSLKVFQRTRETFDYHKVDKILALLHRSRRVVLVGAMTSLFIAQQLQFKLMLLNCFVEAPTYLQAQKAAIAGLNKEDMVILFTSTGKINEYQIELIEEMIKSDAKIVVITQNDNVPFTDLVDQLLVIGSSECHAEGYYVFLALTDYMAKRYFMKYVNEVQ